MPRGTPHGNELAIAFVHGRIDRELEIWAERFSIPSLELKQELGAVLIGTAGDRLPSAGMHASATGPQGQAVATLEVAFGTHGGGPQGGSGGRVGHPQISAPAESQVKPARQTGLVAYWARMTPQQKAAVMRDKLIVVSKKRSLTPMEQVRLKTLKATAKGISVAKGRKPSAEKQKIYAARAKAKKAGLPQPPLPKETAA